MASTFKLEIITPEKKFFSDEVEMVILKTLTGEIGILKDHMPMVIAVTVGPVKIKKDDKWIEAVLSDGFMEIKQHESIIFVDTAESPEEIDKNRALEAKKRAEERLQRQLSKVEYIRSRAALARAMERLRVTKEIK